MSNDSRAYNNLMSRIRIYIENDFARSTNEFSYFNYKNDLRIGGRRVHRANEVSLFLRNLQTIFNENQFFNALRFRLMVSLADLLKRAD